MDTAQVTVAVPGRATVPHRRVLVDRPTSIQTVILTWSPTKQIPAIRRGALHVVLLHICVASAEHIAFYLRRSVSRCRPRAVFIVANGRRRYSGIGLRGSIRGPV